MRIKFALYIVLFSTAMVQAQDLKSLRETYPQAVQDSAIATELGEQLAGVDEGSKPVLLAYKGAVLTLKARFSKKKSDKKEFFKEGVGLIEAAIAAEPENLEIRYLRLGVQENSPRFLGYHKNIEEDKDFILKNYASVSSAGLRRVIKDFVMGSKSFDDAEKKSF